MGHPASTTYSPLRQMAQTWRTTFGSDGARDFYLVSAPGRVNLIGEHTDYHDGFVFPAALDLKTWVLASPRADALVNVYSQNMNDLARFDLSALAPGSVDGWARYVAATAWVLQQHGHELRGVDAVVFGTVPFGGGLSSSAAIEVAWLHLFARLHGLDLDGPTLGKLGQEAENRFVGVPCGIMDQFASANCKDGHAMLLDCRSLDIRHAPIPAGWRIVVLDTEVKHELADGEYAKRQAQCKVGLDAIRQKHPDVAALRDATDAMLSDVAEYIGDLSYRRCRHVLAENRRTERFALALDAADGETAGRLMAASHASLRDDYEVSCAELDRAVELANELPGLIGARMIGGGFGGSTVNLVWAENAEAFCRDLEQAFQNEFGGKGRAMLLTASGGVTGGKLGGLDDDETAVPRA